MELVGKSLLDLRSALKSLSLKTILMVGIRTLTALEDLHACGYIHHDIKPDNIAISTQDNDPRIYLIDLGLSMPYCYEGTHCSYSETSDFQGTPFFCSANMVRGVRATRRDDVEALGYVLIYLLTGKLPWLFRPCRSMKDLQQIRERTTIREICAEVDTEFETYLETCQALRFDEKPNYHLLRQLFTSLARRKEVNLDWKYDWSPAEVVGNDPSEHTAKRSSHKHVSAFMKELDIKTHVPHPSPAALMVQDEEENITPLLDHKLFPCLNRHALLCTDAQS